MLRRLVCIALLGLLPVVLPGCTFFGLGCGPIGGVLQAIDPENPWCAIFAGDCCVDPFSTVVGQTFLPRAATYAVPPFTFDTTLDFAGMSAAHRLAFDVVPET